ncbi:SRR1-like protein [Seminavis robusta]|uniref:SRR1-like protein n=1 Tax=Seminavis robusta TaxID=568900 RepID=A0A9N8DV69_9STRA|nr:SRR1-like protein [Seminavis robusta]|eukprot:Sro395_g134010.1 SRR1-like protein (336) ;mRNA; f:17632-18639
MIRDLINKVANRLSTSSIALMPPSDEWIVVNRNANRRKVAKRKHGNASVRRDAGNGDHDDDDEPEKDPQEIRAQVTTCSQNMRKSQFYENLVRLWALFLSAADDKEEEASSSAVIVDEIVCYGIGNFARRYPNYSGPLWQLALALELQAIILHDHADQRICSMVYYDPLVTVVERQVLQEAYNMEVLMQNEKGKRSCHQQSTSITSLFFMPHCPRGLYENVLWANWGQLQQNPRALCIVGNSLATYVDRDDNKDSEGGSCLELIRPFLREQLIAFSKKDVRDMPGHFEAAFNDTYLTWFDSSPVSTGKDGSSVASGSGWPQRPELPSQEGQEEVV